MYNIFHVNFYNLCKCSHKKFYLINPNIFFLLHILRLLLYKDFTRTLHIEDFNSNNIYVRKI